MADRVNIPAIKYVVELCCHIIPCPSSPVTTDIPLYPPPVSVNLLQCCNAISSLSRKASESP